MCENWRISGPSWHDAHWAGAASGALSMQWSVTLTGKRYPSHVCANGIIIWTVFRLNCEWFTEKEICCASRHLRVFRVTIVILHTDFFGPSSLVDLLWTAAIAVLVSFKKQLPFTKSFSISTIYKASLLMFATSVFVGYYFVWSCNSETGSRHTWRFSNRIIFEGAWRIGKNAWAMQVTVGRYRKLTWWPAFTL